MVSIIKAKGQLVEELETLRWRVAELDKLEAKHKQMEEALQQLEEKYSTLVERGNDGIIVIQVPLGCMREWKSLKNPFVHINFFSEQSLYNCVRLAGLKVLHIKTEITKITRYRNWQLSTVATKRVEGTVKTIPINNLLSTRQQQIRLNYYLLYFFLNFFKLIFKKKLKLFTSS